MEGEFKAASEREQHKPLIVKKVVDKVTKLDYFEEAKLDGKQTFYGKVFLGQNVDGNYNYYMIEYLRPAAMTS